ncbi:lysin A [Mycobacterium phage DarthPhader]|uniref:Lysin A n=1 Tax=Mycobacterium phage DarthPhader TaxID=1912975 RepID=A0A1I9S3V7_9CAUD|nr:endolysin [Mycobacterium phage DarthPhader]AOZ61251.1 lysin A [Mycobacterium phage DarthPhader]
MARPDSENGWRPPWVGQDMLQWADIPGAPGVSMQFLKGWPLAIMRAFAADFHAYIQPLRDADCACYTPTNSVSTSNHLNGTAMDLRWESHPFHVKGTFTADQMRTLRELLAFYEETIYWGGDWKNPIDEMHFQMGYDTWNNPHTGDFILRKIRPDGFSTFRRGDTPTPAAEDPAWVLQKATGLSYARASEILPAVTAGLLASGCTNSARIAMWLAQVGHESVSFKYTEEIAKNGRYAPYIGRTWIQITWDYNYRAFSQWCFERGLVPTSDYFVRDYLALADLRWAGLGAAWYWTVARTQLNALSDARDLNAVTKAINGGYNGLSDRQTRYNLANTMGDLLLRLIDAETGDDMAQVPQEQWDAVFRELTQRHPSRSALRKPGEGLVDTWAGMSLNSDGNIHVVVLKQLAEVGDPQAISDLALVANTDLIKHPERAKDRTLAIRILAHLEKNYPDVLKDYLAATKGTS